MNHPFEMETQRMVLKAVDPALIHRVFREHSKEQIIELFALDETSFERFKSMHEKGMESHRISQYFFLICDKKSGRPIGECGFHTWNTFHHRAELFYLLKQDEHKNKGLMSEALPKVLEHGFGSLQLNRVEALVADWNTPSVKLLQRFGFFKEGTKRKDYFVNGSFEDSDCYSLLKSEWENSPL